MMSQHVPEDLLQAFVEGEVGEQLAVHIAGHLDECPACATRAAGLEPLAAAFAAMSDPVTPPDLAARVLARAAEPERLPVAEIAVGAALLMVAALLLLGLDSPLSLAADAGVALSVVTAVGRTASAALGSFQVVAAVSTLAALAGGLATLYYATDDSVLGLRPRSSDLLPFSRWPGTRRIP
jgi:predicted anti-sigma-YlaC factor YlaD